MTVLLEPAGGDSLPPVAPTVRRLLQYLAPHRLKLAIVIFLMAVFAFMEAVFSILMGSATNIISAGSGPVEPLLRVVFWLLARSVIIWVSGSISQKLLADISQGARCLPSGPSSSATSRPFPWTFSTAGRSAN